MIRRGRAADAAISLRAYAARRRAAGLAGGTLRAVQQAIAAGRLSRSVARDAKGDPKIADADLADREWAGTTHEDRIPLTGPTSPGLPPPELMESRARREAAQAALAEIELAEKRLELVLARDVESRLVNVFSHCKTKLLGVPSRARQQDPGLTGAQIKLIEQLIREALEDLAAPAGRG
jgi:hypothetical protein